MARREKGFGSITYIDAPTRTLKWRATVIDEKTKRTKSKFFSTKKEAQKYLRDISSSERKKKMLLSGGGITFDDFKGSFLEEKQHYLKPGAFETLEGHVKIASKEIGLCRLSDIDNEVVQAVINRLAQKGYSARTQNGYSESILKKVKDVIIAVLTYAASKGVIDTLPVFHINTAHPQKQDCSKLAKNNYIKDEDIIRYEAECVRKYAPQKYTKNYGRELLVHPNGYKLLFLLHTGLRIGEAIALQWDDFDEGSKTITISKNIVRTSKGKIPQDSPKTASGERVIVLNRKALEDINSLKLQFEKQQREIEGKRAEELKQAEKSLSGLELKEKEDEIQKRYKLHLDNHKYIFGAVTFPYGMSGKDSVNHSHAKVCEAIGLPYHVTIHGLRHTYVTHYYIHHCTDKDFDLATFSKSIGHASIRTTMEIYTHLDMAREKHVKRTSEELKDF